MNPTQKAGIVILHDGVQEPEILLIFLGSHQDWSFPKGHCEAGESFEQTAIREVKEETGLDVQIIKSLPSMEYRTPKGEEVILGMFLGTPLDKNQGLQLEHEGDMLEWIPISRIEEKLSYQNLKEYFRANKEAILNF